MGHRVIVGSHAKPLKDREGADGDDDNSQKRL